MRSLNPKAQVIETKIFVVIPAFKVTSHILKVIEKIGPEVTKILVIDDFCPDDSGGLVSDSCNDVRVEVLKHSSNQGVGGAMITGYKAALDEGAEIVVKIDGDGQMDPKEIRRLVAPIILNQADYTKGNRFYNIETLGSMPKHRILGNAVLSFFSKISTGYWNIFDPNNGYTAIRSETLKHLPLNKVEKRFFFETDLLFHLNLLRAVVCDVPIDAIYGTEKSNLSAAKSVIEFFLKHIRNFIKRVFYNYFLREFSLASVNLIIGFFLLVFGVFYGSINWIHSMKTSIPSPESALILVTLCVIVGIQLLLNFLAYDMQNEPKEANVF